MSAGLFVEIDASTLPSGDIDSVLLVGLLLRVCITSENNIILREGGTLCYVGWPQSVLEGAQWKRAELVPADPFADPPRSYSQDNDLP